MENPILCPKCDTVVRKYQQPAPTADVIIYDEEKGIVLIERLNEPLGYALPGGFIDMGEQCEHAAIREMKEETNLDVELLGLLGVYSEPNRDPRFHTMTTVYVGKAKDVSKLKAGDDAKKAKFYPLNEIPSPLCFDHAKVVEDFLKYLDKKITLCPIQS